MTHSDIALAHVVDDYERQRTSAYRSIVCQVDLLVDAQHALANGRLAVVEEFLERAVASLVKVKADLAHPPSESI